MSLCTYPFLATACALDLLPGDYFAFRMEGWQAHTGPASRTFLRIARLPLAGWAFFAFLLLSFFSGLVFVLQVFEHKVQQDCNEQVLKTHLNGHYSTRLEENLG